MAASLDRETPIASALTALFSIVGAVICLLPAGMAGASLGYFPSRMVCTSETGYGSGCDEGGLLFSGSSSLPCSFHSRWDPTH